MGGKITYFFLATVLVLVFGVVAMEGVLLLLTGEPAAMGMGAVAFLLPCVGGWFLWQNTRFARRANRLAAELEDRVAGVYGDLVRAGTGERRREAADAMREAAVRSVRWSSRSVAFPGLAERAVTVTSSAHGPASSSAPTA